MPFTFPKPTFTASMATGSGNEPLNRTTPPPNKLPSRIAQEFESVTDLGERDIMIGDRVFHREHLWACYNLK